MPPAIQLLPDSPEPLYRQLYLALKTQILDGKLADGDRIPATRELCADLGINRTTVSAAYELLEQEGLIRAHVGRGSFVTRPPHSEEGEISFASSKPAAELFPVSDLYQLISSQSFRKNFESLLQLGSPYGFPPLREYLQNEANPPHPRPGEVLVTSGCQQALDLLQRAFVQPGDLVFTEDPVYPGLREVFHRGGARLIGLPVGENGLDLSTLAAELRRERPKLLIVTPDFQNPTGATLPLDARAELLRMAQTAGVTLVENAIYRDLRYHGERLPSLRELDESGTVLQLRSFSKVAFPGLRVGWVHGDPDAVRRLAEAKQWCDLHTDQLSQALLLEFAQSGMLEAHLRRVAAAGRERLAAALEAAARFPAGTAFTRPEGGMSLWVTLAARVESERLLAAARGEGVSFLPGPAFSVSRRHDFSFRLSFAGQSPARIRRGVATLAALAGKLAGSAPEPAYSQAAIV
jgi:DNA-binding transcriptional MocR family regulator